MRQRRSTPGLSAAGLTIVEVILAAFVMALVLASSLSLIGRAFSSLDEARRLTYASQIMQSELEKMRLTQWGDGASAGTGTTGVSAYSTSPITVPIASTFVNAGDDGSAMTMTRVATDVHEGMIRVTLTISWKSYQGRILSRSYITYYGRNGLYDYFIA